jgi:hypothetical protein
MQSDISQKKYIQSDIFRAEEAMLTYQGGQTLDGLAKTAVQFLTIQREDLSLSLSTSEQSQRKENLFVEGSQKSECNLTV